MNLVEDIIKSSKTADLLPHLHELVDDNASDPGNNELTVALQRDVDRFLCPGRT